MFYIIYFLLPGIACGSIATAASGHFTLSICTVSLLGSAALGAALANTALKRGRANWLGRICYLPLFLMFCGAWGLPGIGLISGAVATLPEKISGRYGRFIFFAGAAFSICCGIAGGYRLINTILFSGIMPLLAYPAVMGLLYHTLFGGRTERILLSALCGGTALAALCFHNGRIYRDFYYGDTGKYAIVADKVRGSGKFTISATNGRQYSFPDAVERATHAALPAALLPGRQNISVCLISEVPSAAPAMFRSFPWVNEVHSYLGIRNNRKVFLQRFDLIFVTELPAGYAEHDRDEFLRQLIKRNLADTGVLVYPAGERRAETTGAISLPGATEYKAYQPNSVSLTSDWHVLEQRLNKFTGSTMSLLPEGILGTLYSLREQPPEPPQTPPPISPIQLTTLLLAAVTCTYLLLRMLAGRYIAVVNYAAATELGTACGIVIAAATGELAGQSLYLGLGYAPLGVLALAALPGGQPCGAKLRRLLPFLLLPPLFMAKLLPLSLLASGILSGNALEYRRHDFSGYFYLAGLALGIFAAPFFVPSLYIYLVIFLLLPQAFKI